MILPDISSSLALDVADSPEDALIIPFEFGSEAMQTEVDMPPAQTRVICIASGKGGTGKTTLTVNLGLALSKLGLRVLVLDADFGLANSHLLLGLEPEYDIQDFFKHQKSLEEIMLEAQDGLKIIPGGMGATQLSHLQNYQIQHLAQELGYLEPQFDVMLIDIAAGISLQNMIFLRPAHEIVIVSNPEVTAMMDAYALIKALSVWHPDRDQNNPLALKLILNRVRPGAKVEPYVFKLKGITKKHLGNVDLTSYGSIPFDRYMLHSIEIQEPVLLSHPKAKVSEYIRGFARQINSSYLQWTENQMGDDPCTSYFAKLQALTENYES